MCQQTEVKTNQAAAISVKLYGPQGGDITLTLYDGGTVAQAEAILDTLADTLKYASKKYKLTVTPPAPLTPPQPEPQPAAAPPVTTLPTTPPMLNGVGPGPAHTTFSAEALTVAIDEGGKPIFKVKGGTFGKWGVRIWPETLASAGFNVETLQPGQVYSLTGFMAEYVTSDGKALKVTTLSRATGSYPS